MQAMVGIRDGVKGWKSFMDGCVGALTSGESWMMFQGGLHIK